MYRKNLPFFLSLLAFAFTGMTYAPSLTSLAEDYGRDPQDFDWLFSLSALGFFSAIPLCHYLGGRFGKSRLVFAGLLGQVLAMTVAPFMPSVAFFVSPVFLLGIGGGLMEILATAAISDRVDASNRRKAINFSQVFFCFGAISAPMLAGALYEWGVSWRVFFFLSGGTAALAAISLLPELRHPPRYAGKSVGAVRFHRLAACPRFWMLLLGIFLYVCVEMGIANWVCAYFEKTLHAPKFIANVTLSLYWAGLLLGRAVYGVLNLPLSDRVSILLFYAIAFVSLPFVLFGSYQVALPFVFFTGLGFSIIWPTIMAMASKTFPRQSESVFAFIMGAGVVGIFVGAPLVGRVTDWTGSFQTGLLVLCLLMVPNVINFVFWKDGVSSRA